MKRLALVDIESELSLYGRTLLPLISNICPPCVCKSILCIALTIQYRRQITSAFGDNFLCGVMFFHTAS